MVKEKCLLTVGVCIEVVVLGGVCSNGESLFLAQISIRKLFTPAKALNRLGQKTKMGHRMLKEV